MSKPASLLPDFSDTLAPEVMEYFRSFEGSIKNRMEQVFRAPLFVRFHETNLGPQLFIKDVEGTAYSDGNLIIERKLNLRSLDTQNGSFRLSEKFRHAGLGKKLMYAHLESLKEIGMNGCRIHACDTRGAYTWARFGFENIGDGMGGYTHDGVDKRLSIISEFFHVEQHEEILRLADLADTTGVRTLAGMKIKLTPRYPDAALYFEQSLASGHQTISSDAEFFIGDALKDISAKYGAIDYNNFPIGEVTMQGMAWYGYFDLHNEEQWRVAREATFRDFEIK